MKIINIVHRNSITRGEQGTEGYSNAAFGFWTMSNGVKVNIMVHRCICGGRTHGSVVLSAYAGTAWKFSYVDVQDALRYARDVAQKWAHSPAHLMEFWDIRYDI